MIDKTPVSFERELSIRPTALRISVTDSEQIRAIYELPPVAEILEIQSFSADKISIAETASAFSATITDAFYEEYLRQQENADRFGNSPTYLNRLSLLLENAGRLDDASKYLSLAAQQTAPDSYLRSRFAVAQLKRVVDSGTISELERVAAAGNLHAALNLAIAWLFKRDLKKAISTANQILSAEPLSYDGRLLRGSLYMIQGKPEWAIRDLRSALEVRPNSAVALANMGVAYLLLRNTRKAIDCVRRSHFLNPVDRNVVALLADLYDAHGQQEEIIPILTRYLEFDQKEADMWDRLAKANYQLGRYKDAMRVLRHEASVQDDHGVWNNMALVAWTQGNLSKAKQFFQHSLSKIGDEAPSDVVFRNYLQFLDSIGASRDLLSISSQIVNDRYISARPASSAHSEVVLHHISALEKLGRYEDAATVAEKFLKNHPEPSLTALTAANFLLFHYTLNSHNQERTLLHAERATSMLHQLQRVARKTRLRVINNLTFAYLELGHHEQAIECFKPAKPFVDNDPFLLATLGLLEFKTGSFQKAVAMYKRAINITRSTNLRRRLQQKLHLELGRHYVRTGDIKQARSEFVQSIATKGDSPVFVEEAKSHIDSLG